VITVSGVGELSLINAIAGAYTEYAPVVSVVGTPALSAQKSKAPLHHTLGDANYEVFFDMAKKVTVAQCRLDDSSTATKEIDRVLRACLLQRRPVHIELPADMTKTRVSYASLAEDLSIRAGRVDEESLKSEVQAVLDRLYAAKQPLIIVDGLCRAFDIVDEVQAIAHATKIPTMTRLWGKGIISEDSPNYHGVYEGMFGDKTVVEWVKSCDLVLDFGPLKSDINTLGFTAVTDPDSVISFGPEREETPGLKALLKTLLSQLDPKKIKGTYPAPGPSFAEICEKRRVRFDPEADIKQEHFWLHASNMLKPRDIVLCEVGTAALCGPKMLLPNMARMWNMCIWWYALNPYPIRTESVLIYMAAPSAIPFLRLKAYPLPSEICSLILQREAAQSCSLVMAVYN
jgi:pyruvate decarboxylase